MTKKMAEYRTLYEIGEINLLFFGLTLSQQEKLAEYGRIISIKMMSQPEQSNFFRDVFLICMNLFRMDSCDFELDEIIDKYQNFKKGKDYQDIVKQQDTEQIWFEQDMMLSFLRMMKG